MDVDAMDIALIAALLGVGEAPDVFGQAYSLARQRHEAARSGRPVRWADLEN